MARGTSRANSEFNEERRRADREVAADSAREGIDTPVAREFYRAAIQADQDEIQEQMNDIYDDLYARAKESNPNITSNPFNDKERLEARDILLDQVTDDRVRDQILDGANELKTLEAKFDRLRNQDGPVVGGNAFAVADSADQLDLVVKNSTFLGEGGTEFLRNSVGFEDAKRLADAIIGMKRSGFDSSQTNATAARGFVSDIEDAMQRLVNIEKEYDAAVEKVNIRGDNPKTQEYIERRYETLNNKAHDHLVTLRTAFDQLSAMAFRDDQMYRRILKD
jgi:hypothetical protein